MSTRDDKLGIYVSIPFCRSKCTYCNFASGVFPASEHARYVDRLAEDLNGATTWVQKTRVELSRTVDSVYLGGGTPSLLSPALIAKLFAAMHCEFDFETDCEITMECAPGQLPQATIEAMVSAGVNRVSLGVQSFIDREAQVSGRLHNRAMVEDDIARLRQAGIANINVDLIAGLAGQTPASWEESLDALIAAETPHASVYMLEVDEDSRLGREMLAGGARYYAELVPGDEAIATMYERAITRLADARLMQYEISNFSRSSLDRSRKNSTQEHEVPGHDFSRAEKHRDRLGQPEEKLDRRHEVSGHDFSRAEKAFKKQWASAPERSLHSAEQVFPQSAQSRHNLRYWHRRPYLGIGLDASSALYASDGRDDLPSLLRARTTDDLKEYLGGPRIAETAWLDRVQQHEEAWFLGLRLNAGVNVYALEQEFGVNLVRPACEVATRLASDGLIEFDGQHARLTSRGRLLSNDVFQEFLEVASLRAG